MKVFLHHIYEYKKGLRNLILHTTRLSFQEGIIKKLESENIAYIIHPVGKDRINIFFGAVDCIDVINSIDKNSLSAYNAEEDFILGIMLGYERLRQCKRYLKKKTNGKYLDTLVG